MWSVHRIGLSVAEVIARNLLSESRFTEGSAKYKPLRSQYGRKNAPADDGATKIGYHTGHEHNHAFDHRHLACLAKLAVAFRWDRAGG